MSNGVSPIQIMLNPSKYGYTVCNHCNGYGSSLKESAQRCTHCGGLGLVKTECKHLDFDENQNGDMACRGCGITAEVVPCLVCGEYSCLKVSNGQDVACQNPECTLNQPPLLEIERLLTVDPRLKSVSVEYPGCIQVYVGERIAWFGTANELWGATVYASEARYADGVTDGYIETDVLSTSTDAQAIASAILRSLEGAGWIQ